MIKSFVLNIDLLNVLDSMDDKQAGRLFKVIRAYWLREAERCQQDADTGYDELLKDFVTRLAFAPFQAQFDKDIQRHNAMVERNRANGRKGGAPKGNKNAITKQPTGLKNNPKQPKQPTGLFGLFEHNTPPQKDDVTIREINDLEQNNPNKQVGCFEETQKSPLSNNINNINNIIYNNISKKTIKDSLKESRENPSLFPPPPPPKKKRQKVEIIPPTLEEVEQYFLGQGADVKLQDWKQQASIFYNHYNSIGWCTPNGAKIVRWDSKANLWILEKEKENEKNQRNNGKQGTATRQAINPDCGLIE